MNTVQQYGSECIDCTDTIKIIAKETAKKKNPQDGLVIVVSAMGSIAESIMTNAGNIAENMVREDPHAMFSAGERQTAALMAVALEEAGLNAQVVTDIRGRSLEAKDHEESAVEIDTGKIEKLLDEGTIVVVTGSQGIGDHELKDMDRRCGASSTAVVIAAQLGCECELYGNAEGIHSVDPAVCPGSKILKTSCYEEVMEMVLLGEANLESRALELAGMYNVKLHIKKPFNNGGTKIMSRNLIVEPKVVSGVKVAGNIVIYTLRNINNNGRAVAELFDVLRDIDINIDMISQHNDGEGKCTVAFSCTGNQTEKMENALKSNPRLQGIEVSKQEDLSMVSIIGVGMASHSGVAGKVFNVLAEAGIPYYNITTSEISISVALDSENSSAAVVALGEAFRL